MAGEASQTAFWRVGNVRNGLFPNDSYGKSDTHTFNNFSGKGGITYKLNGRNYFYLNGAAITRAPYYDNSYISARTRDFVQNNLRSEAIQTVRRWLCAECTENQVQSFRFLYIITAWF